MKVLVVGHGGREHALAWKISQSPEVSKIYIAPGNPGTALLGENIAIGIHEIERLADFAKTYDIGLTVVGPEAPLVAGIVDFFNQCKLPVFGPSSKGAMLEGSKSVAKALMKKYAIPTAAYQEFSDLTSALGYINKMGAPIVIKADGLAAGKGVTVAVTLQEAEVALRDCFEKRLFGDAGSHVVIEEFLQGEEASILAFVDKNIIIPMVSAQDHKRVGEGDTGPNTGGMGAYSPAPIITPEIMEQVQSQIFNRMLLAFQKENIDYRGVLYAGLMMTATGPKVIEFNARFGDPETQVILPRLKTDLVEIMFACIEDRLDSIVIEWDDAAAACVVLCSKGYPGDYLKNSPIRFSSSTQAGLVFHAGTAIKNADLVTAGGRVLNVVGQGDSIVNAVKKAYELIPSIEFPGMSYRRDIGYRAFTFS